MNRILVTLCLLAIIHSVRADVLYVAVTGHVSVDGPQQPQVLVEAIPIAGARLPADWPTPSPQSLSTTPDASGISFTLLWDSASGTPGVPGPVGSFTFVSPIDGVWYTAIDVQLRFSIPGSPGIPPVTISADSVRLAYLASVGTDHLGIADIPVVLVFPSLPAVSIVATDAAGSEAGPNNATFTVTRSGPTSGSLTVLFTVSGSASNGSDYQPFGTSVTIPAGAAAASVVVRPIDDSAVESSETVVLTLANNTAYQVGSGPATVTVADNDSTPVATVNVTSLVPVTSERSGSPSALFQITRSGSTAQPLTVKIGISGNATNGTDYRWIADSITIPAGKASVLIAVDAIADRTVEGTESVVLSPAPQTGYTIGPKSRATVSIIDDRLVSCLH